MADANDSELISKHIDVEVEFGRFVREFGGTVLEDALPPQGRDFPNADYVFKDQNVVAELKVLTQDQSTSRDLQRKLEELYFAATKRGLVRPVFGTVSVNSSDLPAEFQRKFADAHKAPVATLVKKANKQIKSTKARMQMTDAKGLLILFNDGNFRLNHDVIAYLLHRVLGDDFSSINSIFYGTVNLWSDAPWTPDLVTPLVTFARHGVSPVDEAFLGKMIRGWHSHVDMVRGASSNIVEIAASEAELSELKLTRAKPGWQ